MVLSNNATCSPIQIDSRPMSSARRPKSRIIFGVVKGDRNVENTPIFICSLFASVGQFSQVSAPPRGIVELLVPLRRSSCRPSIGGSTVSRRDPSGLWDSGHRRDRHRSNRASGRVSCVLWGLSDGSRRAQTKTIKRNCFASAFCYCKEVDARSDVTTRAEIF